MAHSLETWLSMSSIIVSYLPSPAIYRDGDELKPYGDIQISWVHMVSAARCPTSHSTHSAA